VLNGKLEIPHPYTMLRSIIVDDEPKSRENLKIILQDFVSNVTVEALCANVDEAVSAINNLKPDIVFLDIEMQQETGFDLLNKVLEVEFEVIFITAYSEHAIRAIKFSAIDYLLKPIDIEELKGAIQRVIQKREVSTSGRLQILRDHFTAPKEKLQIALPTAHGIIFTGIENILYCEASSNYTILYTADGKEYVASKTLKEYEDLLIDYNFFRIHHSYLVNIGAIKKYVKGDGGQVVLSNNTSLDVSKRRRVDFLNRFSAKAR
jgi:two-component system LytT family response regulator